MLPFSWIEIIDDGSPSREPVLQAGMHHLHFLVISADGVRPVAFKMRKPQVRVAGKYGDRELTRDQVGVLAE